MKYITIQTQKLGCLAVVFPEHIDHYQIGHALRDFLPGTLTSAGTCHFDDAGHLVHGGASLTLNLKSQLTDHPNH